MIIRRDEKINVLIIDDSAFMRVLIADMLKSNPNIVVMDTARNGKEGLEKALILKPDIITLDLEMPVMNGLETLEEIMKLKPVPKVIMLSSLIHEGGENTIKALELGALDFVPKPTSSIIKFDTEYIREELISKIIFLGKSKITDYKRIKTREKQSLSRKKSLNIDVTNQQLKHIVAIGTSTGGPKALQEVLTKLPEDIPAAVLVVQHMPPGFTKSLSERLNNLSRINIKEAEEGDVLIPGWVYIAPGDYHMLIRKYSNDEYRILLNKESPVTGHRPSVNVMMKSVAESGHKSMIAVIMTGMGNDGSEGILDNTASLCTHFYHNIHKLDYCSICKFCFITVVLYLCTVRKHNMS